jgi:FMN phosphatase YigB (HAD superfamily)
MLTPDDASDTVFLLDVDNTLLDNDRFSADLDARLERDFGAAQRARYREIYAALRDQLGYADYLGALQAFRAGLDEDVDLLRMSAFLLDYPFAERLYPQALDSIAHLHTLGTPVVLSDGDIVFQPRKIQRSGLWDAVQGRVLVYLHKERMLDAMQRRFPARHYVMIDDKPHLLAAMKPAMGDRLTTIFVQQGHYARDAIGDAISPAPDITIARISDLLQLTPGQRHTPETRRLEQESMP